MKLTRCENNHYYDAEKYESCPHCSGDPVKKTVQTAKEEHSGDKKERGGKESRSRTFASLFKKRSVSDKNDSQERERADNDVTISLYDDDDLANASGIGGQSVGEAAPAETLSKQISSVAITDSIEEIKTVAYYDFGDDAEPVVGWLVAVNTLSKGKAFSLKCGKNTIGRTGAGNTVDVDLSNDMNVSRGVQAVLIYEPRKRKFLLQPANGSTLIYLNDELVMSFSELGPYDKIAAGETELIFMPLCSQRFSWDDYE